MYTVAVVSLLAGSASAVGGWLGLWFARSARQASYVTALAAGLLLGAALLAFVPGAVRTATYGPLLVLGGFLGLLLVQRCGQAAAHGGAVASAWATLLGMAIHAFFEGAVLGALLQAGHLSGLLAGGALFLHKLPEGLSLSAVVLAATGSRRRALLASGAVGLAMVAGAWGTLLWTGLLSVPYGALLGVAAGSLLYVAASDMLPSLARKSWVHVWLVLLGALMAQATATLG